MPQSRLTNAFKDVLNFKREKWNEPNKAQKSAYLPEAGD